VSGDGDYKMLVDFLMGEKRLEKILFPNMRLRSSLYKSISTTYYSTLDDIGMRNKIERKKKRDP
jgi:hypothetical protein